MHAALPAAWITTVAAFATYLRAANRAQQTIRLRTYYVERLAREIGRSDPFQVTMDDLIGWLACDHWSGETRKSARASVVSFYRWAVDSDRILDERANPARRLPAISPGQTEPKPTPDLVLLQALWFGSDKEKLMLMLAGYGGLRRGEVALVHPDDFDWERSELLVHGKGRKERWVPLHAALEAAVRAELARREAGTCGTGYRLYASQVSPSSYLFPGKNGHVRPDTVGRILERLLAGPWTGHTLRHRFATVAYGAERDLRAVQEMLGHSKPETTARYVKVPMQAKRTAVAAVGVEAA